MRRSPRHFPNVIINPKWRDPNDGVFTNCFGKGTQPDRAPIT